MNTEHLALELLQTHIALFQSPGFTLTHAYKPSYMYHGAQEIMIVRTYGCISSSQNFTSVRTTVLYHVAIWVATRTAYLDEVFDSFVSCPDYQDRGKNIGVMLLLCLYCRLNI